MDNNDLVKAIDDLSHTLNILSKEQEISLGLIESKIAKINNQKLDLSDFIWKYAPMIAIQRDIPINDAIEIAKEMHSTLNESTKRL